MINYREEDNTIVATYIEAAEQLRSLILSGASSTSIATASRRIINELEFETSNYLQNSLPNQFRSGSDDMIVKLNDLLDEVSDEFTQQHNEIITAVVTRAGKGFKNALESTIRNIEKALSRQEQQRTLETIGGSGATDEAIISELIRDGGLRSVDTDGSRVFKLETYVESAIAFAVADAYNQGGITRMLHNGIQYGRVIENGPKPDQTCQFMNGQIVNVSDIGLTPPYHPRCFGFVDPILDTGELEALENANETRIPFKVKNTLLRF